MARNEAALRAAFESQYDRSKDQNATSRSGSSQRSSSSSTSSGGPDWRAIQAMVDAGYRANPDGSITTPDGRRVQSSTTTTRTGPAPFLDPSTGRPAVTGPNGEAALVAGDPRIQTMTGLASWTQPDGRTVYYRPGQNISQGNLAALTQARSGGRVRIVDPTTGRAAFIGPNGEAAWAAWDPSAPANAATWTMPDGTLVKYLPNQNVKESNRTLIGRKTSDKPKSDDDYDRELGATVAGILRQSGLDELVPLVDRWMVRGMSWPEIEAELMDYTTDAGKVVDRLYPEIRGRRENGKTPMSIAEIQAYRRDAEQLVAMKGLTDAFPNLRDEVREWLVEDKSLVEQKARLDLIEDQVAGLIANEPRVKADLEAWQRYYGTAPTVQDLVAVAINADALPTVERRVRTVALDVAAGRAGYGDLSLDEANRLVNYDVDPSQADQQFANLAGMRELWSGLPGENATAITREEQLDAAFGGNEFARRRIARRQRERSLQGQSGGGFSTSQDGIAGIGSAS